MRSASIEVCGILEINIRGSRMGSRDWELLLPTTGITLQLHVAEMLNHLGAVQKIWKNDSDGSCQY